MPPPAFVKVGPYRYRVLVDSDKIREYEHERKGMFAGYTHVSASLIVLDPDVSSQFRRETLWHEVKHAVANVVGLEGKLSEEEVLQKVSPMELAVLRDNPELVIYLTECDDAV